MVSTSRAALLVMFAVHGLSRSLLRLQPGCIGTQCRSAAHLPIAPGKPFYRGLQTQTTSHVPPAFVFDIDGVLARDEKPLPGAHEALTLLRERGINFALVTNGGGKTEAERVKALSQRLRIQIDETQLIQSHTPFRAMHELKDKTVLVCGGYKDSVRDIALNYGYKNVVTTGDILVDTPSIWPFAETFADYYRSFARPLPAPISQDGKPAGLKIDAVLVFHDPRDWALDTTVMMDLLLSEKGYLGTLSPQNGNESLPNKGYQQDGQPEIYFSNPDIVWSAAFPLPRLAQGSFREGLNGVWAGVTGGPEHGIKLKMNVWGKPFQPTFEFAERRLFENAKREQGRAEFEKVYMIGDNPDSDIKGGNNFKSPAGLRWKTILVETGIYRGGRPSVEPDVIRPNVLEAVRWALEDARKA